MMRRSSILRLAVLPLLCFCLFANAEMKKQVLVKVEFWEITNVDEKEYGIKYEWDNNEGTDTSNSEVRLYDGSVINLPGPGNRGISGYSRFSGNFLDAHYGKLSLKIQAGIHDNRARILASPHITVLDGETASINLGDQVPYTTAQDGTNNIVTEFLQTGVKLRITPTIHRDNFVELDVLPEVSAISGFQPENLNAKAADRHYDLPVIATRSAQTNVLVKSGSKFIIGGLLGEQEIKITTRVPVIGSLPIIGLFFSSKDTKKETTDLIITIQPFILDPTKPFKIEPKFKEELKFEKGRAAESLSKSLSKQSPSENPPEK